MKTPRYEAKDGGDHTLSWVIDRETSQVILELGRPDRNSRATLIAEMMSLAHDRSGAQELREALELLRDAFDGKQNMAIARLAMKQALAATGGENK